MDGRREHHKHRGDAEDPPASHVTYPQADFVNLTRGPVRINDGCVRQFGAGQADQSAALVNESGPR